MSNRYSLFHNFLSVSDNTTETKILTEAANAVAHFYAMISFAQNLNPTHVHAAHLGFVTAEVKLAQCYTPPTDDTLTLNTLVMA